MQFEMAHASCPLCKRSLPANAFALAPDTRLCEQCRTIVQTAFSGANSRIAPPAGTVQNNVTNALGHQGVSALDCPQIYLPVFVEDRLRVTGSFEQEAECRSATELYDELNPVPDLRENADIDDGTSTLEADLSDFHENGPFEPAAASMASFEAKSADIEYIGTDDSLAHDEPRTFAGHAASSPNVQVSLFDDQGNEHTSEEEIALDPWENPLPAWDYSHNEWPVLVGQSDRKAFRKWRAPLAALLVLAFAAGFYFLMGRPSSTEQPAVPVDSVAIEGRPAAAEPQPSAANSENAVAERWSSVASSDPPASADSKPAQTAAADPTGSGDNGNSQGRFSLQAAAFPTQASANEFAQKLRHAGVPSYVVSTDLAKRGRWFRVRVGRFNAADEAQRFAAEAQLRARAAGMSLQLIGCQYEKP